VTRGQTCYILGSEASIWFENLGSWVRAWKTGGRGS